MWLRSTVVPPKSPELGAPVNQAGDMKNTMRRSGGNRSAWPGVGGGAAVW
jgi:hypothetical protein